jgi:hypothetical protein
MSHRAAWFAWSVCAVSLVLMAFSLLLVFLGWSEPLPRGSGTSVRRSSVDSSPHAVRRTPTVGYG